MPTCGWGGVIDRLRGGLDRTDADGELLGRFVDHRDEAAFAELVRRHSGRVYAVCRRAVGDRHLAEDACQATFLVLARKAHAVRPREAVGGFLYGVARKAGLEALAVTRRRRESSVARLPDEPTAANPPVDADALAALDDEIANLSDPLRAAVVLCELDGVARKAAAARLGVAEGTLSSRLAAARKQLAARLAGRGVTLPAALAAVAATGGMGPAWGSPSTVATEIARGVMRAMSASKLKVVSAGLVLAALAVSGGMSLTPWSPAQEPPPAPRSAVVARPAREGAIVTLTFTGRADKYWLQKPDGTLLRELDLGPGVKAYRPVLSPDGRRLAVVVLFVPVEPKGSWTRNTLAVYDLTGKKPERTLVIDEVYNSRVVWAPDGRTLLLTRADPETVAVPVPKEAVPPTVCDEIDIATGTRTRLGVPSGHEVFDVSPDGKTFLTVRGPKSNPAAKAFLLPRAGGRPQPLTDKSFHAVRFSPDGSRVLGQYEGVIGSVRLRDQTFTRVQRPGDDIHVVHACWSPDGKRIAYVCKEEVPRPADELLQKYAAPLAKTWYADRLVVAATDGSDAKTIRRFEFDDSVQGVDWR